MAGLSMGPISPFTVSWSATYSGDAVYGAIERLWQCLYAWLLILYICVARAGVRRVTLSPLSIRLAVDDARNGPITARLAFSFSEVGYHWTKVFTACRSTRRWAEIASHLSRKEPGKTASYGAGSGGNAWAFSLVAGTYTSAQERDRLSPTQPLTRPFTTRLTERHSTIIIHTVRQPNHQSATGNYWKLSAVATGLRQQRSGFAGNVHNQSAFGTLLECSAPAGVGTHTAAQSATITDATTGATIYDHHQWNTRTAVGHSPYTWAQSSCRPQRPSKPSQLLLVTPTAR